MSDERFIIRYLITKSVYSTVLLPPRYDLRVLTYIFAYMTTYRETRFARSLNKSSGDRAREREGPVE